MVDLLAIIIICVGAFFLVMNIFSKRTNIGYLAWRVFYMTDTQRQEEKKGKNKGVRHGPSN